MKNKGFLILLGIAVLLFLPGAFMPHYMGTIKPVLMISGAVVGFVFYLLTFIHAMTGHHLSSTRITIFRILLICLPIIGNLIYVIFYDAQTSPQRISGASSSN